MESPNISVLANLIRNPLAKLDSDSPLATWRVVSAIPVYISYILLIYDKKDSARWNRQIFLFWLI